MEQNGLLGIFQIYDAFGAQDRRRQCIKDLHEFGSHQRLVQMQGLDKSYKEVCGARLAPVLEMIELMKALGVWVEVTTLIIPGLNDGIEELRQIARFVKKTSPEIAWHVTRFHPAYKYIDRPPTPVATLRRAREIGIEEGLKYVYGGNVPGERNENTYCPACGALLIERSVFEPVSNRLKEGACPECGTVINGVGL